LEKPRGTAVAVCIETPPSQSVNRSAAAAGAAAVDDAALLGVPRGNKTQLPIHMMTCNTTSSCIAWLQLLLSRFSV